MLEIGSWFQIICLTNLFTTRSVKSSILVKQDQHSIARCLFLYIRFVIENDSNNIYISILLNDYGLRVRSKCSRNLFSPNFYEQNNLHQTSVNIYTCSLGTDESSFFINLKALRSFQKRWMSPKLIYWSFPDPFYRLGLGLVRSSICFSVYFYLNEIHS